MVTLAAPSNGSVETEKSKPLDVEALLNRAAVAFARSQKLVESWLPLSKEEKEREAAGQGQNTKDDLGLQGLLGRPERAGLGADISTAAGGEWRPSRSGAANSELEKLRRQMLGKKAGKVKTGTGARINGASGGASNNAGMGVKGEGTRGKRERSASEDDEEEGRSGAFKSKREQVAAAPTLVKRLQHKQDSDDIGKGVQSGQPKDASQKKKTTIPAEISDKPNADFFPQQKRPNSYLDEILLARRKNNKKQKKKKKKKKQNLGEEGTTA